MLINTERGRVLIPVGGLEPCLLYTFGIGNDISNLICSEKFPLNFLRRNPHTNRKHHSQNQRNQIQYRHSVVFQIVRKHQIPQRKHHYRRLEDLSHINRYTVVEIVF